MGLEIRRNKNIIALRQKQFTCASDIASQSPFNMPIIAFHSQNLEAAEISHEVWNEMATYDFRSNFIPDQNIPTLSDWQSETSTATTTQEVKKFKRQFTINVTQICNLHCSYCAAGGDGSFGDPIKKISIEKTLPQLRQFIDLIPHHESIHVTFLGGEPLLYPDAIRLIAEYVNEVCQPQEIETSFLVVTNGTLLTADTAKMLADIKASVTISIDGPKLVNDQLRPTKNKQSSTDLTIQGLQHLMKFKNKGLRLIGLSGVFGHANLNLVAAYEFYRQFNVDWYEFNYDYTESNEAVMQKYLTEYTEVLNLAMNYGKENEIRKIKMIDQFFYQLDEQKRIVNHCSSGKSFLMIDARNDLYDCPWEVGQKNEKLDWQNDANKVRFETQSLIEQNNCHQCWAKYLCGGGCKFINKIKTGDKHQKDLQFCERTRYIISLTLFYYQQCRA